ncbi:MAG: hypothetical protein HRU29_15890 [Rhizobiales bacterium]|nr:hypothetical protein [Hyphomicrobiales bacterium]NRB15878.1 hypothetical protein [Hyphomicrobiales bacterium]
MSALLKLAIAVSFLVFGILSAQADGAPATNKRKDGPRDLTYIEAKIAMGYPEKTAGYPMNISTGISFAIIDEGFRGVRKWALERPDHNFDYVSMRKNNKSGRSSHGFKVLKTAYKAMPDAKILLIEAEDHLEQFEDILKLLKKRKIYFVMMSLGAHRYLDGEDVSQYYESLKLLEEYQITLLKSSGNSRKISHVFDFMDSDSNGRLEFSPKPNSKGRLVDYNRIYVKENGKYHIFLSWVGANKDFEMQIVDSKTNVLHSQRNQSGDTQIEMVLEGTKERIWVRILDKNKKGVAAGTRFVMSGYNIGGAGGLFNGQESLNVFSQYESPFLISIGAFGMSENGELEPSLSSSIGHTNTKQIAPYLLGPGQIIIDGEKFRGTSYSTPFVAAMYAPFMSYNIKNYIEATTSFDKLKKGLVAEEMSRFGVPDYNLLRVNECTKNSYLELLEQNVKGKNLIVEMELTRHCMEGLDYTIYAYFSGHKKTGEFAFENLPILNVETGKKLFTAENYYSKTKNIDAKKIILKLPLKNIPREYFGKSINLQIRLATRAQADPVTLGEEGFLIFELPEPKKYKAEILGLEAARIAQNAVNVGGFHDAIEMSNRAMNFDGFNEKQLQTLTSFRRFGALGLADYEALKTYAKQDINAKRHIGKSLLDLGGVQMALGDVEDAIETYKQCLDDADAEIGYRCNLGYIAANFLVGKNVRTVVKQKYANSIDDLANSQNVHARGLAVFLGKLSSADFDQQITTIMRANSNADLRSGLYASSQYYLGLIGFISKDYDYARKKFRFSAASGGVYLQTMLSEIWQKRL